MTTFKARIERTLRRMMVRAAQDKKGGRLKLDESILECLAALPPTSRDEDFEDLYYFMIESFQFSGVPVACDETDVDQVSQPRTMTEPCRLDLTPGLHCRWSLT